MVSVMLEIINVTVPQETQCVVDIYFLSNKRLFVLSENKKRQILFISYMVEQTWNMVGPNCTM